MRTDSLWFDVTLRGTTATVTPRRCPNCGKTKITSDPCGFDHLAALLEFNSDVPDTPPLRSLT